MPKKRFKRRFSIYHMKDWIYYDATAVDILNVHKYLMKKHDIK